MVRLRLSLCFALLVSLTSVGVIDRTLWADTKEAAHKPLWGYHGETGPEFWGDLSADYAVCKTGKKQSPIDFSEVKPGSGAPLAFHYGPSKLHVVNNHHTIVQNYEPGSYVVCDGVRYELKQFHFHSVSEHTVKGDHYPMEMHLVHQSEAGGFLVVGIFLEPGEKSQALAPVWQHMPRLGFQGETKEFVDESVKVDISQILPDSKSLYSYDGSFTTPPGTEGVKWFVFQEPVAIGRAQLLKFKSFYSDNYRPTQPLNGRTVTLY